ncbi:amidohydrolase [uncultured Desulfovibrio sp.]|uniref:amidohydrolase n=1 Tax=uncultured Desulfovibrio sp. TaxID=167968 RepID=UPI0026079DA0|nr:amidohydrolase [uncultured Desulfovibrio sp.]
MNRDFAAMNADPAAREDFVRRCLTCIDEACEAAAEDLVRLRRDLHRHPETAWAEYRTAALAAQELAACGFEVHMGAEACDPEACPRSFQAGRDEAERQRALAEGASPELVARMAGGLTALWGDMQLGDGGPLIALRFDMDANAGLSECADARHQPAAEGFSSCHDGRMHACGHDGHMAIGLGLARVLARLRETCGDGLRGRVRLVFQPAEEEGEGAPGMVAAGAMRDVKALFALHIGMQAGGSGRLVCGTRGFLATTNFRIGFDGKSAHAGTAPQQGHNALLAACTAVCQMQAIPRHGEGASRINVGELHARETPNIIPAHAWLRGETRGATSAIDDYMMEAVRRIADAAARMHQCSAAVSVQSHCPGATSSPGLTALVERAARAMNCFDEIVPEADFGASEDCSWFMNHVQEQGGEAVYLQLGADRPSGHHTATFTFDEAVLPRGTALLSRCIFLYLHENSSSCQER